MKRAHLAAPLLVLALGACGGGPPNNASDAGLLDAGDDATVSDTGTPVMGEDAGAMTHDGGETPSGHAYPIWLDFNGGVTYELVDHGGSASFDPFSVPAFTDMNKLNSEVVGYGPLAFADGWRERRAAFIERVRAQVTAFFRDYDVEVVVDRPAERPYARVMLGGTDGDRGHDPACGSRVGYAALLCGGPHGSIPETGIRVGHVLTDCEFAFLDSFGTSIIAAHELGHAFGLLHVAMPGTIMAAGVSAGGMDMGTIAWGSGPVMGGFADTHGDCMRGPTQDSEAILRENLGVHRARLPVQIAADHEPPHFDVLRPAEGDTVPPDFVPCVRVSDASALDGDVHFEQFAHVGMPGDPDEVWFRIAHQHAPGPSPTFVPGSAAEAYRVSVADEFGNLAEERVHVTIDPDAPPVVCD